MKKLLRMLLCSMLVLAMLLPAAALADRLEDRYNNAVALMADGRYGEAADAFDALGVYEDASMMAMYCRGMNMGAMGMYSIAADTMKHLGEYRDAPLFYTYYTALGYEAAELYETAGTELNKVLYFRDSLARVASYPEKINARDYRKEIGRAHV